MSTPYIGEIRVVGFSFAPQGWLICNGQSLRISEFDTLFALIGTTYGGDGITTFNVPNMQSRIGVGSQNGTPGPSLSSYPLGVAVGSENVMLNSGQMPPHQHSFSSKLAAATAGTATATPANQYPGPASTSPYAGQATGLMNANALTGQAQPTQGSQPHPNIQPVQAMNYIICYSGIFPPLN